MGLFNINYDGSKELEELTGQWYASSPYRLIEAEIEFATRDVRERVGNEVVDKAEYSYSKNTDEGLVRAVQLPVACLAILRYSALATLSHESTGRKLKMDDNEKIPFEWMVDRDDRAMRERYYRALDALYGYLLSNDVAEWRNSGKQALVKQSIVKSMAEFEETYPIEGSYYVYYMLQSLVIEAQNGEIRNYLGQPWKEVLDGKADPAITRLARKAVVLSAVITAGERWSLEVFPLEIARRFSPTYQGNRASNKASIEEIEWYLKKIKSQRNDALAEIKAILSPSAPCGNLLPENDKRKKYFTTV